MTPFLRKLLSPVAGAISLSVDYGRAIVGSALFAFVNRIRRRVVAADPNADSKKIAIYVVYDRHGLVHEFALQQVIELRRLGYRTIFACNSPRLAQSDILKLKPHVWLILHRRNLGHDFGSYRDSLSEVWRLGELGSLVLMNDSCYGPFHDLAQIEACAVASGAKIFGITDSWAQRYHLQTYFLWLEGAFVQSSAFRKFWRYRLPYQPRRLVIHTGELAFTQEMLRRGFTTAVMCPYETVARIALKNAHERLADEAEHLHADERKYLLDLVYAITYRQSLNPTHSFWDVLVTNCGCPFIKRDLLRRNPMRIPGLIRWVGLLNQVGAPNISSAQEHLKLF